MTTRKRTKGATRGGTPARENKDLQVDSDERSVLELEDVYSGEQLGAAEQALLAEMGIEGDHASYVIVHKRLESGEEGRIFKDTVEKYDLDALGKRFGTGEYIVRYYLQVPEVNSGRYVCRATKTFHILLDPDDEARAAARRNGGAAAPAAGGNGFDAVGFLQSQQKMMMDLLGQVLAGGGQARGPQLKELADFAALIRPAGDRNNPVEMLEAFERLQRISGRLGNAGKGEAEGEGNSVLSKAVEGFFEVVKGAREAPPRQLARPQQPEEGMTIKKAIEQLLAAAAKNRNPELYGNLVYEEAPDQVLIGLQAVDWFEKLCLLAPACKQYEEWLTAVRTVVVGLIKEDQEHSTLNNPTASVAAHANSSATGPAGKTGDAD